MYQKINALAGQPKRFGEGINEKLFWYLENDDSILVTGGAGISWITSVR